MKQLDLIWDLGGREAEDFPKGMGPKGPDVKVLTPSGEVYTVEGVELEPDEQNGNDILWIRTELAE